MMATIREGSWSQESLRKSMEHASIEHTTDRCLRAYQATAEPNSCVICKVLVYFFFTVNFMLYHHIGPMLQGSLKKSSRKALNMTLALLIVMGLVWWVLYGLSVAPHLRCVVDAIWFGEAPVPFHVGDKPLLCRPGSNATSCVPEVTQ